MAELSEDEDKLEYLTAASRQYAHMDCASKGDEEREKCFLIRSTLRGFTLGVQNAKERLSKCGSLSMIERTGKNSLEYVNCVTEAEQFLEGHVEEHFEKLGGLGFSPSS